MRFNELMTGARQDVVCKIYGENLDSLTKYAGTLNQIIQTVDGAVNIYEEKVTGMPQVVIKYNRDGMSKYGLNVADINKIVNSAFAGQIAGQVYEEEKRFDMVVRLDGDVRKNMSDIENLSISTPKGLAIPLSAVASIEQIEGVNQIQRENTKRRIIVGFNVNGKDVQTIVKELQSKINQNLHLTKGYTIEYGGSFENMTAAKERLSIVVPIALLLIFLLLYFAFGSAKQGLLIYTAIPLSAMGGIFALWGRSMPFSISAGVGFIALFGVAVLNGILLVTEFNRLKAEGWHDVKRIVIHATKSKLRAVLMTAFVPALGFIPMAISTGAGGEVQKPLATVVIGGLIISTLLTLFVLPVMYILFEKGVGHVSKIKTTFVMIGISLFLSSGLTAQEKISINAAMDSALNNNAFGKVAAAQLAYYQALERSNFDIEKTAIGFGYGKINGFNNDNQFNISQSIQFPTVYKYQGAVNKSNIEISNLNKLQKEVDLKTMVKKHYYHLVLLQQRRTLLMVADSIYSTFVNRAVQKFNAGSTDILEKVTAENQLTQIKSQVQAINASYSIALNQFNILLNCSIPFEPLFDNNILLLSAMPDMLSLDQTPALRLQEANITKSEQQLKLEKSKLSPNFNMGYNSATIMGWQTTTQNNERYFGSDHRFGSFNVGLSVPLFAGAQKAKINASNIAISQNKLEKQAVSQQLQASLKEAISLYLQNKKVVEEYQRSVLPNTKILIESATKKMNAGEIGYLEWVMIINQAIQGQNEYLGYVQQLNDAAIEVEKLSLNN
jgi:cobalt-zinc-cadmium resistance protein CzcA